MTTPRPDIDRSRNRPFATVGAVVALVASMAIAVQCTPAVVSPPAPTEGLVSTGPTSPNDSGSVAPPGSVAPSGSPASPSPSGTPYLPDPTKHVGLIGTAPAALAYDGQHLWVYSVETGDIGEVDLISGVELRSIHVGGLGSHLVNGRDGTLYVGRFDKAGSPSGADAYLLAIESASGKVSGIDTGPLGALTLAPDGSLLALEKADRLLRIDPKTRVVEGKAAVNVDDEHMEVVATATDAWVASDHTPLRRISLAGMKTTATIDVGGGIPFVVRDGLIWGARPDAIWAVDPNTGKVARTIPLTDVSEVLALDIDGTDAWLGVRDKARQGYLTRIDLTDGHVVGHHLVGLPAAVKILGKEVWVASYLDNEVAAFDR